ncbi:uncharacterized protein LOC141717478 [Apium graveolens]|uniref:uncharacterized protein LOC141717478 n=1 Tax=Apium graveolens TaxID=4045 RepID=UPI003D798D42
MMEDDWVKAATNDGTLVAELLVSLLHSPPTPPPVELPMKWTVKQPRTRVTVARKAGGTRGSPTTPLNWNGGYSSPSGGPAAPTAGYVSGESSRPGQGSKLTAAGANEAGNSKRGRKKRTIYELKEAEIFMLSENKELKETLAGVLGNLGKMHSENTDLKRAKVDLASKKPKTSRAGKKITSEAGPSMPPPPPITREVSAAAAALPVMPSLPTTVPEVKANVEGGSNKFVVPDLNVALVESNKEGPSEMMN